MSARAEAVVRRTGSGAGAKSGPGKASRANIANAAEKTRGAFTALNLHFAGVALLALLNLYLLVHMGYLWQAAHSQNAEALAQQRVQLKTAQIAAAPLEGLDGKLQLSTDEADGFYERRLPYAYSQVLTELGNLAKKENAKLTRVQYGYTPIVLDPAEGTALTEIRMDASLTGDYRPLVQFVNDMERDKSFFLISAVTLTGQQSGTVSLRIKLTTYLRPARGDEKSEPLPAPDDSGDAGGADGNAATTGGPAR
jgi:type IV pilus assembly protein PilO